MLKLENVVGGYVNIPVLKDISFEVADGELVGLIGLNGAGKSTTINEIMGLLTPYEGSISVDGLTLAQNQSEYRKKIGFIPETPSLYEELTLKEHIETVAMAYDIDEKLAEQVNAVTSGSKIKDRIEFLCANGYELEFNRLLDRTFYHNLAMIDYKMPELLSLLFLSSYFVKGKKISDVVAYLCGHYYEFSDQELVEYKVKDLLVAIALGMVPKTK